MLSHVASVGWFLVQIELALWLDDEQHALKRNLTHDAYTVRVYDRRFTVLATAHPGDARRWVGTTWWLHHRLLHDGRLVVGLGVQWTPTYRPLPRGAPHVPATLQLCVGHRCLVFQLGQAGAVPEALRRFLADPRATFVGSGCANDCRMLRAHYGLRVARGRELRALAGMGNASVEEMAGRLLGYPGITKSRDVAVSAWDAPRLSASQVLYAAVDAYLAFRLGLHLCPDGAAAHQQPSPPRANPPPPPPPVHHQPPAAPPADRPLLLVSPLPPGPRGPAVIRPAAHAQRDRDRVLVRSRQAPTSGRGATYHAIPRSGLASLSSMADSDILVPLRPWSSDSDDDGTGWFCPLTDDEEEEHGGVCTGVATLRLDDTDEEEEDDSESDDLDDDEEDGYIYLL